MWREDNPLAHSVAQSQYERTILHGDVNMEYACKRGSARLQRPRLFVMRAGWSERLCRADFARGRRETQHKWSPIAPAWDDASRAEVVRCVDEPAEVPS